MYWIYVIAFCCILLGFVVWGDGTVIQVLVAFFVISLETGVCSFPYLILAHLVLDLELLINSFCLLKKKKTILGVKIMHWIKIATKMIIEGKKKSIQKTETRDKIRVKSL